MKIMGLEMNEEAWKRKWETRHRELDREKELARQKEYQLEKRELELLKLKKQASSISATQLYENHGSQSMNDMGQSFDSGLNKTTKLRKGSLKKSVSQKLRMLGTTGSQTTTRRKAPVGIQEDDHSLGLGFNKQ